MKYTSSPRTINYFYDSNTNILTNSEFPRWANTIKLKIRGGGGGGGAFNSFSGGGGGGGSGCINEYVIPIRNNTSYEVVVGSGGTGGSYKTIWTDGQSQGELNKITFMDGRGGSGGTTSVIVTNSLGISKTYYSLGGGGGGGVSDDVLSFSMRPLSNQCDGIDGIPGYVSVDFIEF